MTSFNMATWKGLLTWRIDVLMEPLEPYALGLSVSWSR
jgi:hypothetical protein